MGLFVCSKQGCDTIENTALGLYWHRSSEPLCSECGKGEWHGRFTKEKLSETPGLRRKSARSFYLVSVTDPSK